MLLSLRCFGCWFGWEYCVDCILIMQKLALLDFRAFAVTEVFTQDGAVIVPILALVALRTRSFALVRPTKLPVRMSESCSCDSECAMTYFFDMAMNNSC